ncbi:N-acetylneuraminate synthase family protein [Candidatus Pelagibacter sp.]|nr:N-acetylneuraminate synthase family protein [Candidatus Pelagibacter sp.]
MNNKFQLRKIESAIKKNKRFILIGRGASSDFFLKSKINKNDFLIGFNTYEISYLIDIYFTNKKDRNFVNVKKDKIIYADDLFKRFSENLTKFQIGKIYYSINAILYLLSFLSQKNNKKISVVCVGFDFRSSLPESDYKKFSWSTNILQNYIDIVGQKDVFFRTRNSFSNLKIKHAGFDLYSDLDPRNINKSFNRNKKNKSKIKIVAEITTNHFGETENIIELIKSSKKADADYVKFQVRDVETFYPKKILQQKYKFPYGNTFYDYRKKLELTDDQIKLIMSLGKKLGIKPFFSILDISSYERLKKFNLNIIKIPSTISMDNKYLKHISKNFKKEIVVSTGMTNANYLKKCANLFKKNKKIYMLHCVSSYPTSSINANINNITSIKELSKKYKNIIPGYSSHDLTRIGSSLAIGAGARMIEKHVKLKTNDWAHFDQTALDVNLEFPQFVEYLRSAEKMLGSDKKTILDVEHHKYYYRKS